MATKGNSIKYGPCTDWGKSSVLVHGGRQYKFEEVTKWTNLGKFEEADKRRELQEFLAMQVERAKEATTTSSEGTVYTWDLTQQVIDEIAPEVEAVVVDGEEAIERVTGLIREGLWVQLWGSDESDGADLTPPSPTPAGVAEGEGITLEDLGRSVKIPLNEDEGLFDEEGNWVAGSDYKMSVGGSEAGADTDMKMDEDREETGMEASKHAPGAKGKGKEGEEGKGNESMAQEGIEWQWEVADSRDIAALVRDINWWGERLARFRRKDGNLAGEKARWRKLAMDQIKATGDLIEAGADMEVERAEPQEHGGWLCLTKWADRIPGIRKREAFIEEIGRAKGYYDMVNRVENEGQMRDMVKIMQRMEESMELVKGKLGVGTIEEIERAKRWKRGRKGK